MGLILRYQGDKIYCLEATSNQGVGFFNWGKNNSKNYILQNGWLLRIGTNFTTRNYMKYIIY